MVSGLSIPIMGNQRVKETTRMGSKTGIGFGMTRVET